MIKKLIGLFCIFAFSISMLLILSSCTLNSGGKGDENPPITDNGGADVDNNKDDDTDADVEEDTREPLDTSLYIPITVDGKSQITFVSSYSKEKAYLEAYNALVKCFIEQGIKLSYAYEASNDANKPELIIGDGIGATGESYIDPHSLGDEGYAIRVVGNKIIVAGGSTESLVKAINLFSDSILKLKDADTDIKNLGAARSTDVFVRQYYPITSISIADNDLAGYDIVVDTTDEELKLCADKLHTLLYDNAGYWLNVRPNSAKPSIRIILTDYAGDDGFRVYASDDDLLIECAYPALLTYAFDVFLDDFFTSRDEREIQFGTEAYTVKISEVSYSDYGAVGDGVTDDYEAIKATHDAANKTGQTVVAESGKTYYLGQHSVAISVKTDTVWTGATFIIDDSTLLPGDLASKSSVFMIESDKTSQRIITIDSLSKGQTNVGATFDGPTLLYLVYGGKKQYIRYGNNADSGADQQEIILVDKDGNVDPSTPILWDYPYLTSVAAYSAYDRPITIKGGTFVTIANAAPREYTYYSRNITIKRSNVTFDGITHLIEGEGSTGAPYEGFITITCCSNVLVKNAILTGHKVYKLSSDSTNSMGTYDISINKANNVTFKDCRQSNSITDTAYWGIMGSNYSKNLTYDGCVFSRFDAHKGTHNATIINSEIGHQKLSIIGSGTLLVENTVIHGNNIVNLRNDYGSTWDGDMIFRNVTLKNTTSTPTLINVTWYNHDFGYTCHLPENITIDGIKLEKGNTFYVFPKLQNGIDTDTVSGVTNNNPIVLTKKIIIASNPNGYNCYVSQNTTLFGKVELIKE